MHVIACLLCSIRVYAYDFEVDGIYYNIISSIENTVEVTNSFNATKETPYNVADVISLNNNGEKAWVKAYIVGQINGRSISNVEWDTPFGSPDGSTQGTNIVIAENLDDKTNIVPVQLPFGDIRNGLNLIENPELDSKEVLLYGEFVEYFGTSGIKNTVCAIVDGVVYGTEPDSDDPSQSDNTIFSISFTDGLGDFVAYSVSGDQIWSSDKTYGAKISGFANSACHANEDWLISPALDLSGKQNVVINFEHAINKGDVNNLTKNHTLWISSDYNEGDPTAANWTQVEIVTYPDGESWTYVNSGDIVIPAEFMVSSVRLAFKYLCNDTESATWEIKDLKVRNAYSMEYISSLSKPSNTTNNYTSYIGSLSIPSNVIYNNTSYSVISIGRKAFYGCTGLTSITIPNSAISIRDYAFWNCTDLKKLTIENGNSELILGFNYCDYNQGEGLFYNCPIETLYLGRNLSYSTDCSNGYSPFYGIKTLKSVTIGNSVTKIGDYSFRGCASLTEISIPKSISSIGLGAFRGCTGLTEVNYNAENCTTMGSSSHPVFDSCINLSTINIGDNVKVIPDYTFSNCAGLIEIIIPNNVTSIGSGVFQGCAGLTSITIPNSVIEIGDWTFANCAGLTFASIPNSIKSIGIGVFYNCNGLTKLAIPNSITSIGEYTFYGCNSLYFLTIPENVSYIGNMAFTGCSGLRELEWNAIKCSDFTAPPFEGFMIESVRFGENVSHIPACLCQDITTLPILNLPTSLKSIGDNAFRNCSGLRKIIIPGNVETIGYDVFNGCNKVKDVESYATTAPTIKSSTFSDIVYETAQLKVPNNCIEKYAEAPYWNYFVNIDEGLVAVKDIEVDANYVAPEYYDLDGRRIVEPTNGIYIVKQDNTVRKVIVNKK